MARPSLRPDGGYGGTEGLPHRPHDGLDVAAKAAVRIDRQRKHEFVAARPTDGQQPDQGN
jgi:hypothetical protein